MLLLAIDSIQTKVDTLYIATDNQSVLTDLINSQNYIYGSIILILLFILSFNFFSTHRQIKKELTRKLDQEVKLKVETIIKELKTYIDTSIESSNQELKESIALKSGDSYRLIAYFLGRQNDFMFAAEWCMGSIDEYLNSNKKGKSKIRYSLENLKVFLGSALKSNTTMKIYETLTDTYSMATIKEFIERIDNVLGEEKKAVLKYLEIIEKGKDNDTIHK